MKTEELKAKRDDLAIRRNSSKFGGHLWEYRDMLDEAIAELEARDAALAAVTHSMNTWSDDIPRENEATRAADAPELIEKLSDLETEVAKSLDQPWRDAVAEQARMYRIVAKEAISKLEARDKENERLRRELAEWEEDSAALPEDRSITETVKALTKRAEIAEQVVAVYEEYVTLLSDELRSFASFAAVHGISSKLPAIDKGNELRERIAQLQAKPAEEQELDKHGERDQTR